MKKSLILTLLAILTTVGMRAADYQYLVFTLSDGTTQAIAATNLNISFADGNLVATNGTETLATLPLTTLTQMEFSNDGTTGISPILNSPFSILNSENEWYDLNGRKLDAAPSTRGVYILKNNSKTIQVSIK